MASERISTESATGRAGSPISNAPMAFPAAPARVVGSPPVRPRRIGYFVSRFPVTTETFIVREAAEVVARPGMRVDMYSLFPAPPGAIHRAARPWLRKVRAARPLRSASGLAWCWLRHPWRMLSATSLVCLDYGRRPLLLVRALIGLAAAAGHVRTVSRRGTDHLHAHFGTYPALAAWLCHRLRGTPFSFTVHAHDLFVHQLGLRRRVDEAEFVVAISEHNRRLLEALGSTETPVHVVHCGIDLARYEYAPRAPAAEGAVRVLCVASLEEKKGHRFLLEALAKGGPVLGRIHLDLVGSGKLREELESMVSELGLADRVRFLQSRPEHEVAALLASADLFVLPSTVDASGNTEGIPVALMEAMACGVPVIASRLSGIPELIADGHTGLLVGPEDVAEIQSAITEVVEHPQQALARAPAARRLIEQQFDLHACAGRIADLLGACPRPGVQPASGPANGTAIDLASRALATRS